MKVQKNLPHSERKHKVHSTTSRVPKNAEQKPHYSSFSQKTYSYRHPSSNRASSWIDAAKGTSNSSKVQRPKAFFELNRKHDNPNFSKTVETVNRLVNLCSKPIEILNEAIYQERKRKLREKIPSISAESDTSRENTSLSALLANNPLKFLENRRSTFDDSRNGYATAYDCKDDNRTRAHIIAHIIAENRYTELVLIIKKLIVKENYLHDLNLIADLLSSTVNWPTNLSVHDTKSILTEIIDESTGDTLLMIIARRQQDKVFQKIALSQHNSMISALTRVTNLEGDSVYNLVLKLKANTQHNALENIHRFIEHAINSSPIFKQSAAQCIQLLTRRYENASLQRGAVIKGIEYIQALRHFPNWTHTNGRPLLFQMLDSQNIWLLEELLPFFPNEYISTCSLIDGTLQNCISYYSKSHSISKLYGTTLLQQPIQSNLLIFDQFLERLHDTENTEEEEEERDNRIALNIETNSLSSTSLTWIMQSRYRIKTLTGPTVINKLPEKTLYLLIHLAKGHPHGGTILLELYKKMPKKYRTEIAQALVLFIRKEPIISKDILTRIVQETITWHPDLFLKLLDAALSKSKKDLITYYLIRSLIPQPISSQYSPWNRMKRSNENKIAYYNHFLRKILSETQPFNTLITDLLIRILPCLGWSLVVTWDFLRNEGGFSVDQNKRSTLLPLEHTLNKLPVGLSKIRYILEPVIKRVHHSISTRKFSGDEKKERAYLIDSFITEKFKFLFNIEEFSKKHHPLNENWFLVELPKHILNWSKDYNAEDVEDYATMITTIYISSDRINFYNELLSHAFHTIKIKFFTKLISNASIEIFSYNQLKSLLVEYHQKLLEKECTSMPSLLQRRQLGVIKSIDFTRQVTSNEKFFLQKSSFIIAILSVTREKIETSFPEDYDDFIKQCLAIANHWLKTTRLSKWKFLSQIYSEILQASISHAVPIEETILFTLSAFIRTTLMQDTNLPIIRTFLNQIQSLHNDGNYKEEKNRIRRHIVQDLIHYCNAQPTTQNLSALKNIIEFITNMDFISRDIKVAYLKLCSKTLHTRGDKIAFETQLTKAIDQIEFQTLPALQEIDLELYFLFICHFSIEYLFNWICLNKEINIKKIFYAIIIICDKHKHLELLQKMIQLIHTINGRKITTGMTQIINCTHQKLEHTLLKHKKSPTLSPKDLKRKNVDYRKDKLTEKESKNHNAKRKKQIAA